jgi:serine/threonine protein kinase/predicted ATPase
MVDRYLIEGVLGEGGMAMVYLARHAELGSLHALKVLSINSQPIRARFRQEGRLQSKLRHPNIVTVTDVIQAWGAPALVMDFVSGPDLAALLHRCSLSDTQIDRLVRGILRGVRAAHGMGLVHRDLKPSNILVEVSDGQLSPRISDFGLAKMQSGAEEIRLTRTGVAMGTPGYMAPEQIEDARSVDARADVFSLGAILYEALTGRMAFDGSNILQVWSRITQGEYVPIDRVRKDLPDGVIQAIHGALEPDPDRRIPDVQTLLETWETGAQSFHLEQEDPAELWKGNTMTGAKALVEEQTQRIDRSLLEIREGLGKMARTIDPLLLNEDEGFGSPKHGSDQDLVDTILTSPRRGSRNSHPGNLPDQVDRFIGRTKELAELKERLFQGVRLLTVMGAGGMGKTRLSLVFGEQNRSTFPGGVWFCDLTEARSEDEILRAVAQTLSVQLSEVEPARQLAHAIQGRRRTLLILDNMEQVVDHAASTVGSWVRHAPEALFLVTSRVRLGLQAEQIFLLDPLTLAEALQLFEDRARRVRPDFSLSAENREVVVDIVDRLDRMSLAIELAAARVQLMSPGQILERLGQRFRLLQSGRRDQSPRQTTLRGAIDWSWNLLHPGEQAALAQCCVFRGGFTLEAAEAVLDLEPWDAWPIDVIHSLVEQSLLRRTELHPGQTRLHIYESIREYAREKMGTIGAVVDPQGQTSTGLEAWAALRLRHGHFYAGLGAEDVLETRFWSGNAETRRTFQVESDNLAGAMEFSMEPERLEIQVPATLAWVALQQWSGPYQSALETTDRVLMCEGIEARSQIRLLDVRSTLLWRLGRPDEATSDAEERLALARKLGDQGLVGVCLSGFASAIRERDRPEECREMYREALELLRRAGDRRGEAEALLGLGGFLQERVAEERSLDLADQALQIGVELGSLRLQAQAMRLRARYYLDLGDMERADADLQGALERARSIELNILIVNVLSIIGTFTKDQGRLEESVLAHAEAIRISRETGNIRKECVLLGNLALVVQLQGDLEQAQELYQETIEISEEIGFVAVATMAVGNLGDMLLSQGRLEESGERLSQAIEAMDDMGLISSGCFRGSLAWVRAQQEDFAGARELLITGEGQLRGVWTFELGRLLCRRAQVEKFAGQPEVALAALDEARQIAEQVGAGPDSDLGQLIAEAHQLLFG